MRGKRNSLFYILILLLLSSCASPAKPQSIVSIPSSTNEPTPTVEVSATYTLAPTVRPSPTFTPTPEGFQPADYKGAGCIDLEMQLTEGTVIEITDGDTIVVNIDGQSYEVRYIGIDAPEGGQTYGNEASTANAELLAGQEVILIKDTSEVDQYGRLLRYVFTEDYFINYEMIKRGFAWADNYPPDDACAEAFLAAQSVATKTKLGLWENVAPTIAPSVGGGCDYSYPTVCIPSPPPELDCGDISFRRFTVQGADAHHFDGDHDGVGCES